MISIEELKEWKMVIARITIWFFGIIGLFMLPVGAYRNDSIFLLAGCNSLLFAIFLSGQVE